MPFINKSMRTPGILPEPQQGGGLFNSPSGDLGLRILANNGPNQNLGSSLAQAILGQRQSKAAAQDDALRRKYMEAQIAAMGMPKAPQTPQSIQEYEYAKKNGYGGSFEEWSTPRTGTANGPREVEIARILNDPNTPEAVKRDLRNLTAPRDATPSYSQIPLADGTYGVLNNRTGKIESTGQQAPPKGQNVGQAQKNQDIGIQNLSLAVDEYVKALPSLSMLGYLNPQEHARIGTVYNNMMLQAKEAYNLGVLNGPDFEILQKVVTDPMTVKGAVTSKEALAKQAMELKRIMGKMRGNVNPAGVAKDAQTVTANPADPLGIR